MDSRKALIDYVIGNEFISKPELQQKFINLLNKHEQALQLQQTGVSGSTFIAISKETGKAYVFYTSDMYLWINDEGVDIYEVKYYR